MTTLKVMRLVDDTSLTIPTVKMTCDCGWVEKAYATREARDRAERHMKETHTHGILKYLGHSYEV